MLGHLGVGRPGLTSRLEVAQEVRRRHVLGRLHVVVQVAVAEGGRSRPCARRGSSAAAAGRWSRRRPARRDSGTEMSCLMFRPSSLCASGIDSRRCHIACDCDRFEATAASSTRPRSSASASSASKSDWRVCLALGVGLFEQHRPRRRRQRAARAARNACARALARTRSSPRSRSAPGRGAPARAAAARRPLPASAPRASAVMRAAGIGVQHQGRRGDDAERAFRADEEVAQVVAGVVLAQAGQAVPDLAGGG